MVVQMRPDVCRDCTPHAALRPLHDRRGPLDPLGVSISEVKLEDFEMLLSHSASFGTVTITSCLEPSAVLISDRLLS